MSPELAMMLVAVGIYFAAMLAIGIYAARQNSSHEDYMLGGRRLGPFAAALSAGASDMSAWLLMGLPGAIYAAGLIEAWIAIGLSLGAYLNWALVAPRLRAYTEVSNNSITIPSFFENRLRDRTHILRIVSAVVILVFFTLYISSGMVAGGEFFVASFGGEYLWGMLLVGGTTLLYTFFGGFLGATLTDVVQGMLIMAALVVLPIVAIFQVGGWGEVQTAVEAVDPAFFSLIGEGLSDPASIIAIISSLAWGLGYFGQPHIIVRFMALRSHEDAKAGRRIGIGWMVISLIGTTFAAFIGIAYFQQQGLTLDNPEHVVLAMSQALFHPLVAGFVLAAVLAAIMSTISSQLIVTSSALVEDLYRIADKNVSEKKLAWLGRLVVLMIAVIAILLALSPDDTILGLVSFAWAGFGAAFGPLILLSLFWRRLTNWGAIAGMVTGAVTVFLWKQFDPFALGLYELLPAFVLALVVAIIVSLATYSHDEDIQREFTQTGAIVLPGSESAAAGITGAAQSDADAAGSAAGAPSRA
ncbi:sodium/proline symporter PutP [Gulosibacter bifidus]|uniref:Sodium/proline symporter n=1 Tax=Gulosibacter bifidus TaxID=272239 RepID=A0ABW5RJ76_9MICO|nr:sodium/proline symporter PutP [Gulosibacter bifidus]